MNGYFHQSKNGCWEGHIDLPRGQDGRCRRKAFYGDTRSECELQLLIFTQLLRVNGESDRIVITEWEPHPDFLDERD